ncbi:MAG: hypothetical protein LBJ08_01610 [Bifidobacteriaceae bacterium]|jgi:hypothetical protein|nr:hypothetical protein [Bifidobacteriaceae bacterium]
MTDQVPATGLVFEIEVPPAWFELDLRPASRDRAAKTMVERTVKASPELWEARGAIVRYVRGIARQAWDAGARYCMAFAKAAGDGVLVGALTITVLPPLGTRGRTGLTDLMDQVSRGGQPGAGDWSMTDVVTMDGAGKAVRRWGVRRQRLEQRGKEIRLVFHDTFIPVQGAVVLVACASPDADVAEPLLEVFQAVTDTLVLSDAPEDAEQEDS